MTETVQPKSNKLGINLGIIKGLPIKTDTYAKLDTIRSVHLRRIFRIKGVPDGKIIYKNINKLQDINNIINENFIMKIPNKILTT